MEIIEENKILNETLSGFSPSSQPADDPQKILKPSLEESVDATNLVPPENNGGGGGGGETVVVTTTVVEKTEISVVKMTQEDGDIMGNQEEEEGVGNEDDKGNEEKGVFDHLVDGDEGMKVDYSGNGTSFVEGIFADEDEQTAIRDPMDICLAGGEEKNEENAIENFESKEDMKKNNEENDEISIENFELNEDMNKIDEENVENGEDNGEKLAENEEEYEEEQDESEDHNFVVGDFVWGKIKSHPWWPGQIYDPSDASDYAATLKRKGQLLVAYFGDGSFSWCSPSQLKPFIDHFPEMSNQSDSKKFVNAVQTALDMVSRLVQAELMCNGQTANQIENAGVVNSGIKEGVAPPKGNTIKVLMKKLEPVELVTTLKAAATMDPVERLLELELTVLKSYLSAFYSRNGGYLLAEFHDGKCIEGLEDETRSGSVSDYDMNGPSESAENGDDKLYQTRKQKSVAELLGEDEPRIKKVKTSKDTGVKRERKRKALVVSVTPESDHESGGGGVEEETMSPRQRKKSKYLSPPYLSPIGPGGKLSVFGSGSGSGSFKEPKSEPEKVPEMAAKQLEDSLKKSSGKRTQSRQKRRVREGSDSQDEHKKPIHAAVNVKKVLQGLLIAALDPPAFVEKNLPTISEFISIFRSSIFEEGSNYQKHDDDGKSDLGFIKQKLEALGEMVQRCEESEMSVDVKACLETGIQEVLEKVGKMRGE